jgi:hypothetical protein
MALRPGNRSVQQSPAAHLRSPSTKQVQAADSQPRAPAGVSREACIAQAGTQVVDDDSRLRVRQERRQLAEEVELEQLRRMVSMRF